MTLEQKALEMRSALDAIELALMGFGGLADIPARWEDSRDDVVLLHRVTVGEVRQVCNALDKCNRIVNSPEFIPANLTK